MSRVPHAEIRPGPNSPSSQIETPISPDDYRAVTRGKNHKWTLEQKVTLYVLVQSYQNDWTDKRTIFNSYIADELEAPHPFSGPALRSMHSELQNTFSGPFGNWSGIRRSLEVKARSLGIFLESSGPVEALQPQTPSNSRSVEFITGLPTPTSERRNNRQRELPRLGFRAFDRSNQGINSPTRFLAGRFMDGYVPVPPSPQSLAYREEARKHVERHHEGVTPFISTTWSLLRALSISYWATYPSSIAVIDLHKAGRVEEYGIETNPYIQHVYQMNLKRRDRDTGEERVRTYIGKGDFLIYGEIKEEAIIKVVKFSDLINGLPILANNCDPFGLENLQSSKSLSKVRKLIKKSPLSTNYLTGEVVGKLLRVLGIPAEYLDDGTFTIIKDWAFKDIRGWQRNEFFKNGVVEGFDKDPTYQVQDLAMPQNSGFMISLREAASIWTEEDIGNVETQEFVSIDFMRELHEAAEVESVSSSEGSPSDVWSDMMQELDCVMESTPDDC